jgi:predicted nucleic acid-binding protein
VTSTAEAGGPGLTFVDSNILVYAHDATEREKQPIARAVLERLWADRSGALSTQVLQEFYVVATRKLATPMPRADAREALAAYSTWHLARVDPEMILDAAALEERARLSFWDALIVEAAVRVGATRILTEDFGPGRTIEGVTIEDPFAAQADPPL